MCLAFKNDLSKFLFIILPFYNLFKALQTLQKNFLGTPLTLLFLVQPLTNPVYPLKCRGFGGEIWLIFFKQIYFQIICLIGFLIG